MLLSCLGCSTLVRDNCFLGRSHIKSCITAFSDVESSVATLVYNQMIRVAPLVGAASGLRWPSVLSAMLRLGASAEALQKHSYACPSVSPLRLATDSEWQDKMVYRLISVVEAYAG